MPNYFNISVHPQSGKRFLSASLLKNLDADGEADQKALAFGTAFHSMTLEPTKQVSKDVVKLLTANDAETINAMRSIVWTRFGAQFTNPRTAYIEKEFYRMLEIEVFGELRRYYIKGKIDHMPKEPTDSVRLVTDLKSTSAWTHEKFVDACVQYGYFLQAYTYMLLTREKKVLMLGVQKSKRPQIFEVYIEEGSEEWAMGKAYFIEQLLKLDETFYTVIRP